MSLCSWVCLPVNKECTWDGHYKLEKCNGHRHRHNKWKVCLWKVEMFLFYLWYFYQYICLNNIRLSLETRKIKTNGSDQWITIKQKSGRPEASGPGILADCPWLPVRADLSKEEMIRWSHLTQGTPQPPNHPYLSLAPLHSCQQPSSPLTSCGAAQNSIPPCSVNHDSSSTRQDWNLKCISLGPGLTAHMLHCSISVPAQPGWPAAVQGQLRVSGNWRGEGWAAWAHTRKRSQRRSGRLLGLAALGSYERLDGSPGWLGAGRLVHRWCKVFRV